MPFIPRIREWDFGRPRPPYALNKDCWQAQGLAAWWPMAERSVAVSGNPIVRDWSGNLNHLAAQQVAPQSWQEDHNAGVNVGATRSHGMVPIFASGSGHYLLYNGAVLTAEPMTLVAWWLMSDTAANYTPLSIGTAAGSARWQLTGNSTSTNLRATSVNSAGTVGEATSSPTYAANQWLHQVGVFASSTDRRSFVNGENKATDTTAISVSGVDRTTLGARYASGAIGAYLNGRISDVRIYNRALSDEEVFALYNPATRWDLYYPIGRKSWFPVGKAASAAASSDPTGPLLWMP